MIYITSTVHCIPGVIYEEKTNKTRLLYDHESAIVESVESEDAHKRAPFHTRPPPAEH